MMKNIKQIKSIVIVGGGTSGWMTAASLAKQFEEKEDIQITLVESSQIGTIGVGEATIPTLRRFYQRLGFDDLEVLKGSAATCKLGIEFVNWHKQGESFIHPFGIYGQSTPDVGFHHYWLRNKTQGCQSSLADYSMGVQLAKNNKFALPSDKPASQLEVFDWALHFDAALFAELMKKYSLEHGVTLIDDKIVDVICDSNSGNISQLQLLSGQVLTGDLFVDCSGFKSLLLQQTLQVGYENWSQWLFCDSAVAVQTECASAPLARTQSIAHEAGWQWKIPLQHRQGNGHVYCSQYIDQQRATDVLLANVDGEPLHQPRHFTFTPGRAKKAWSHNCVAIGLSSGFLEPLESTSIALVQTAIEKLASVVKDGAFTNADVTGFNNATIAEYERVRDFIILHYKLTQRDDSQFWRDCQHIEIPTSLQEKIDVYRKTGNIQRLNWEIFGKDSWLAIFDGFNVYPNAYDIRANNMKQDYLADNLTYMRKRIAANVDSAMSHPDFLNKYCQYQSN